MGTRLQRFPDGVPDDGTEISDANGSDDSVVHESHYDGQTFAWGPGQVRSFGDDAVGLGHATFYGAASVVRESSLFSANGQSRS